MKYSAYRSGFHFLAFYQRHCFRRLLRRLGWAPWRLGVAARGLELVRRFNVARGRMGGARLGLSNLLSPASDTDSRGLGLAYRTGVLTNMRLTKEFQRERQITNRSLSNRPASIRPMVLVRDQRLSHLQHSWFWGC